MFFQDEFSLILLSTNREQVDIWTDRLIDRQSYGLTDIWIDRHMKRQTYGQIDIWNRHMDRQSYGLIDMDRQAYGQIDIWTDRHMDRQSFRLMKQTNKQIRRQTEGQKGGETDRKKLNLSKTLFHLKFVKLPYFFCISNNNAIVLQPLLYVI